MTPNNVVKTILAAVFALGCALVGWALGRGDGYAVLERGER
jgi:hypothetical protein